MLKPRTTDLVQEGDYAILYIGYNDLQPILLKHGESLQNKHGHFFHSDFIGKPYGHQIKARHGVKSQRRRKTSANVHIGWVYLLRPNPELWAAALTQRTQIIQSSDQAVIISELRVRSGSVVIESGTGSGALSSAFVRAVAPSGCLHTFEFNESRVKAAEQDFRALGLTNVSLAHRDVCTQGFPAELDGGADAVLLDVPNPWLAIPHAKRSLRPGGRVCTYSPCIEQVQRNCQAMADHGFHSVVTIECRLRTYNTSRITFREPGLVDADSPATEWAAKAARVSAAAGSAEEGGRADVDAGSVEGVGDVGAAGDQKAGKETDGQPADKPAVSEPEHPPEHGDNTVATSTSTGKRARDASGADTSTEAERAAKRAKVPGRTDKGAVLAQSTQERSMITARTFPLARGHTAFLSFATRGAD